MITKNSFCKSCTDNCCLKAGAYVSKRELKTLPNPVVRKFVRNKKHFYQLKNPKSGCQYLSPKGCILPNRLLACLLFPFLPTKKGWMVRTYLCPNWDKFTKKDLEAAKKLFNDRKSDRCNL